jgi:amidase
MNAFATAAEMAAAIRKKTISATELVELMLRRIEALDPSLNAIVWDLREPALARAAEADRALAEGRVLGPLHGVPITIKESFAIRELVVGAEQGGSDAETGLAGRRGPARGG